MKKALISAGVLWVAFCAGICLTGNAEAGRYSGGGSSVTFPVPQSQGGTGDTLKRQFDTSIRVPHVVGFSGGSTAWSGSTGYTGTVGTNTGGVGVTLQSPCTATFGKGFCIECQSTAAGGAIGGLVRAGGEMAMGTAFRAVYRAAFTRTASIRNWIVLDTVTLSGSNGHAPPTSGVGFLTTQYIGFGYDPAVNGGRWVAASGDGTTESGTDTGVTYTANTLWIAEIECYNYPTSCSMGIGAANSNGGGVTLTYITKSANLPGTTAAMGTEQFSVTSIATSALADLEAYELDW